MDCSIKKRTENGSRDGTVRESGLGKFGSVLSLPCTLQSLSSWEKAHSESNSCKLNHSNIVHFFNVEMGCFSLFVGRGLEVWRKGFQSFHTQDQAGWIPCIHG